MLVELTGLWSRKNKNGEEYFMGRLGNSNVLLFRNKNKKNDKEPDFRMFVGTRQQQQQQQKQENDVFTEEEVNE